MISSSPIGSMVGVVSGIHKGARGNIIGYEGGNWIVDVFGAGAAILVRCSDLRLVPEHWIQTTRRSLFDQMGMLTCFGAPDLSVPVPNFDEAFTSRACPPGTALCTSFWGGEVYTYMFKRLKQQLLTQSSKGTLWNFVSAHAQCGIVFSDGTKGTQAAPYQEGWGSWWPVLFVRDQSCPGQFVAYCQAQALSGSRAWATHPSRIVRLREATTAIYAESNAPAPTVFVETPGVVIDEIVEEEEPKVVEEEEPEAEDGFTIITSSASSGANHLMD